MQFVLLKSRLFERTNFFISCLLQVDGVPGLILCSGIVVAVGREPFRPANYSAQKSPSPTWRRTKQMSLKRQKALNRKFIFQ